MSKSTLLALTALVLQVYSAPAGLACNGNNIINPNVNGFAYPSGWSTDQPAPLIKPGQDCSWLILVPQGKYAKLEAKGKIGNGGYSLLAHDGDKYMDASVEENLDPYFFPGPKFYYRIYADTNSTDTLGFKITWVDFPAGSKSSFIGSDDVTVKKASEFTTQTTLTAAGPVSIVVIPAVPNYYKKMRSTLIFNGPSVASPFMGSIFPIVMTGRQLFGDFGSVTILNLNPVAGFDDLLVLQDYTNTKDYNNYAGLGCTSDGNCDTGAWAPGTVKSVFISASNAKDTITDVTITDDATFSVYNGTINPKNLVATYTSKTLPSALPLSFPGYIKQYVVSIHNSKMMINRK